MAYDAAHGNVVNFGGSVGGSRGGDTWIWDGTNWTQLSPLNSPPARASHSMADDEAHGQVVLFGVKGENERLRGGPEISM
jgi:hypothetical protein